LLSGSQSGIKILTSWEIFLRLNATRSRETMVMQSDCINPENIFSMPLSSCWSYGLFLKTHPPVTYLIKSKAAKTDNSYLGFLRSYKSLITKKAILCKSRINLLFFSGLGLNKYYLIRSLTVRRNNYSHIPVIIHFTEHANK